MLHLILYNLEDLFSLAISHVLDDALSQLGGI